MKAGQSGFRLYEIFLNDSGTERGVTGCVPPSAVVVVVGGLRSV